PEVGLDSVEAYRRLADADRLPLDVHVSVRTASLPAALDADLRSGGRLGPAGDARPQPGFGEARVGWLKLFADGSLGSRTAAMLEPFEPSRGEAPSSGRAGPADRGILQLEPGEIAELVRRAATGGLATQIHAIGDAAVRVALDAFEAAGMEPAAVALQPLERHRPPPRPLAAPTLPGDGVLRPRIEHVQLVDPVDLPRFARLGVVASVQPAHLGSDAATARAAWGERAARSYGYGSLARAGATLAFGTDAPVEPWDPWPGLEQAVTRRGPGWPLDVSALGIAEALDLATALRAATVGPAVAAGRIDRGRLVPGCRGDLIVVPAAAFREPVEPGGPLGTTRPDLVLIAGREAATR
ncbi:MAG TPA: amidohydrolase family protein, partial [Candidatus Dormibacteraeota bacterium]|nr:amidohydrolase family protein [Candidatus Dormibacteraeota bacterium]